LVGDGANMTQYGEMPGETPSARASSVLMTVETPVRF
jgi:hypothetical protein